MVAGWLRTTARLGKVLRESGADVVHANSGVAALACCGSCLLLQRPLIWHQHDIVPQRRVNRMVLGTCGRICARVVAVSEGVARSLRAVGLPPERIVVLHNAVRPEFFQPLPDRNPARDELGLPREATIVAMAGRLVPYKGHRLLLEAIARLRSEGIAVRAAIAGDAPRYEAPDVDPFPGYVEELRARAAEPDLAGQVVFLGYQEDVRPVLAAADILAAPSRDEPFPLIVLEALASGAPVVASDSGGHPEAVRDGETGLLFRTGDAGSLAAALHRLITDPDLRHRLGRSGRQAAETAFSETRFNEALAAVYRGVMRA